MDYKSKNDNGWTFFRVLGRSNAFSHMEQEWILLRHRAADLSGEGGFSFCGGDGGLKGGIAMAGGTICSSRVAMDGYMSLICGGPVACGTWELEKLLLGDANSGDH